MCKIVYIHGLNGSSESETAVALREEYGEDFLAIDLPNNPADWAPCITKVLEGIDCSITIVASSTGGLFAQYFSNRYNTNLVLINPVIKAADLHPFVGENEIRSTGEKWVLSDADIESLAAFETDRNLCPTVVIVGMKDDVISPAATIKKYENRALLVKLPEEGHRIPFDQISQHIREIINIVCL